MGDQGWYTDCEQGHAKERVSGMAMPDRAAILAMGKRG